MVQSQDFSALVAIMTGDDMPRVWSFVITIFGDLARGGSTDISGALIRQLTERIGLKPEATRVALHRLRKEGWIEARKTGRTSVYSLGAAGQRETRRATPVIYDFADSALAVAIWITAPDPAGADMTEGLRILPQVYLGDARMVPHDALCLPLTDPEHVPDWVRDRLCPGTMMAQMSMLADRLNALERALEAPDRLSPTERAVLRVLVVHGWRRVRLRMPDLPDALFPVGWRGSECRATVARLLDALPAPSLDTLEEAAR